MSDEVVRSMIRVIGEMILLKHKNRREKKRKNGSGNGFKGGITWVFQKRY